jgi:hypothetical protein
MQRTLPFLLVLAACFDSAPAPMATASTTSPGPLTTTDPINVTDVDVSAFGTQVGSEGFWGCTITSAEAISGDVIPEGFVSPVADIVAAHTGVWPLQFTSAEGTSAPVDLELVGLRASWITLDGDCAPYLAVELGAQLRTDAVAISLPGQLAAQPDAAAFALSVPADREGVQAAFGAPSFDEPAWLQVDAALDPTTLMGDVRYGRCADGCPVDELGRVDGAR